MAVIKNIILDWSGTLVNDFPPVLEATNEIFRQYGKPAFTEAEFREKFFLPFPEFYKIHLPEATMVQLDHYYHSAFKLLQEGIPLLPHALEFLQFCQAQSLPIFLLSTIHAEHFAVQGERLGVKHFFKQAYVQAIDKRKTILHLLAEHDLDPRETLFIGDMQHDIETARHGGVVSCAVLTGYDSLEKLKASNPDLLFRDLQHVREYLSRHRDEPELVPVATVGALIFNAKNEVLMIKTHKWSHKWGIPGGKIKGRETAEAALRRELLEETGLEIFDLRFQLVQDCVCSPEFYKKAHFVLLNYTVRTTQREVTLNEEAEESRWVTIEEALTLPLNQPTKVLIDYVRSHSN
jgi:phosphoglycolate phosphatase-like HAD superfamily hydrolase/ADP-ribose pyrophosphatase YjhB (NUDIX family)